MNKGDRMPNLSSTNAVFAKASQNLVVSLIEFRPGRGMPWRSG